MKKITKLLGIGAISLTSMAVLASCKKNVLKSGDIIFTNTPYVDVNNLPRRLNVKVEAPADSKTIEYIYIGTRIQIYDDQFSYRDGILSIDTKAFVDDKGLMKTNTGDRTAKIKFKNVNAMVDLNILFVDKVITTADELQRINENPAGSYILGNDIDCSSISNFEPLGFTTTASSSTINKEFLGVFDGNGYSIKNIVSKYSNDLTSEVNAVKTGTYLFDNASHRSGDQFGVFQNIGSTGVVRNTGFDNIKIYGRSISGVISGMTSGVIENCFVAENCSVTISTHFWDEACNAGVITGFVAPDGVVRNCISLGKAYIQDTFKAYAEDYVEENLEKLGPDASYDDLRTWDYYGAPRVNLDSNGDKSVGVYAGVGMVHGEALNNYCSDFEITTKYYSGKANFGQTHIFANKEKDGPDAGTIYNSLMKSRTELDSAALYEGIFDRHAWNIYDGSIPTLRAFYSFDVVA